MSFDEIWKFYRDGSDSGISSRSVSRENNVMIDVRDKSPTFSQPDLCQSYPSWSEVSKPHKLELIPGSTDYFPGLSEVANDTDSIVCLRHKKELCFYCIKCDVKTCIDCHLSEHSLCYSDIFPAYRKKICESALSEYIGSFVNVKSDISRVKKSFDSNLEAIKKRINSITNRALMDVERKRSQLLQTLNRIEKEKTESWKYQTKLCDRAIRRLKSYKKYAGNLDFKNIENLRKYNYTVFGDNLIFIEDEHIEIIPNMLPKYTLGRIVSSPNPKKSTVILPKSSFSNQFNDCTVIVKDLMGEEVTHFEYILYAVLEDENFQFAHINFTHVSKGTFKLSYYPTTYGKHRLHVFLNYIPIDKSPYGLEVLQNEMKDVTSCGIIDGYNDGEPLLRPWGVCSDFEGRILVTDRGNNCVKIFWENGQLIKSFGKDGSEPGELMRPAGITVDRKLRRILVADKDNHRIQIFNYDGVYISHFGSEGQEDGQFFYPWDIAVNENSQIAVSDSKNHRIQLFNKYGHFICKFCFHVKPSKDTNLPRGVAFRSDGWLMFTDFNASQIGWLDKNLKLYKTFGSEGAKIKQFFRPQSIDVDDDGKFAVSDCKNQRIQVFDRNGNLYCIFGTQGSDPGKVDSPQGICFLSGQRIAVVELNNNRVQIFQIPKGVFIKTM